MRELRRGAVGGKAIGAKGKAVDDGRRVERSRCLKGEDSGQALAGGVELRNVAPAGDAIGDAVERNDVCAVPELVVRVSLPRLSAPTAYVVALSATLATRRGETCAVGIDDAAGDVAVAVGGKLACHCQWIAIAVEAGQQQRILAVQFTVVYAAAGRSDGEGHSLGRSAPNRVGRFDDNVAEWTARGRSG